MCSQSNYHFSAPFWLQGNLSGVFYHQYWKIGWSWLGQWMAQKNCRLGAPAVAAYHSFSPFPTVYFLIFPFRSKQERKGMVNTMLIGASMSHLPMCFLKGASDPNWRKEPLLHYMRTSGRLMLMQPYQWRREAFYSAYHPYPATGKTEAAHTAIKPDPDDRCY